MKGLSPAQDDKHISGHSVEQADNFFWLGTIRVILVCGSEEYCAVAIDDVGSGDRQLPTVVAVDEGQVDEGTLVDDFLFVGNAIGEADLSRDFVAGIRQKNEA